MSIYIIDFPSSSPARQMGDAAVMCVCPDGYSGVKCEIAERGMYECMSCSPSIRPPTISNHLHTVCVYSYANKRRNCRPACLTWHQGPPHTEVLLLTVDVLVDSTRWMMMARPPFIQGWVFSTIRLTLSFGERSLLTQSFVR